MVNGKQGPGSRRYFCKRNFPFTEVEETDAGGTAGGDSETEPGSGAAEVSGEYGAVISEVLTLSPWGTCLSWERRKL